MKQKYKHLLGFIAIVILISSSYGVVASDIQQTQETIILVGSESGTVHGYYDNGTIKWTNTFGSGDVGYIESDNQYGYVSNGGTIYKFYKGNGTFITNFGSAPNGRGVRNIFLSPNSEYIGATVDGSGSGDGFKIFYTNGTLFHNYEDGGGTGVGRSGVFRSDSFVYGGDGGTHDGISIFYLDNKTLVEQTTQSYPHITESANGVIYGVDYNNDLYKINNTVTQIGSCGGNDQGVQFYNGSIYVAGYDYNPDEAYFCIYNNDTFQQRLVVSDSVGSMGFEIFDGNIYQGASYEQTTIGKYDMSGGVIWENSEVVYGVDVGIEYLSGTSPDVGNTMSNISLDLRIPKYMPLNSTVDYRVTEITNNSTYANVTANATVTSANSSVIQVNSQNYTLESTSNINNSSRITINATYDSMSDSKDITTAPVAMEYIDILPPLFKTFAVAGNIVMQYMIFVIILGITITKIVNQYGGIGAMQLALIFGWVMGWIALGVMLLSAFFAIFIILNSDVSYEIQNQA